VAGAAATLAVVRARGMEQRSLASAPPVAPLTVAAGVLPVRFSLDAPAATTVSIVGDFNGWNPVALPMRRSADGARWEVDLVLPPGRYSYAFVVDGRLSPDPRAPRAASDDFGMPNSVLMVRGS
jgi:1,4-alpha-glucan branching enzyme